MLNLPDIALSVRQPWAWAIIWCGKDIENRSWQAVNHGLRQRGRICIHAAKGMTRDEYESATNFMARLGVLSCRPPLPHLLDRGCIIGTVEVADVVDDHPSPWFMGPRGLVLKDPKPIKEVIPAVGALGYFKWQPALTDVRPEPARWMLPEHERPEPKPRELPLPTPSPQRDLL